MARQVAPAGLEGLDRPPTVGERDDIEAELFLTAAERGIARADGDERLASGVDQERVSLVALEPLRHGRGGPSESLSKVECRQIEQLLE